MTEFCIYSPSSYRNMPWRNGLGSTIELLSEPAENSTDFMWRVSVAEVASDGPFSNFNECDRVLVLLEGNGITLHYENQPEDELCDHLAQARFLGDTPTHACLHDGPIRDFNVISQRRECSTKVDVLNDRDCGELHVDGDTLLIYAVDSQVSLQSPQLEIILIAAGHLLRADVSPQGKWLQAGGSIVAIQIYYK